MPPSLILFDLDNTLYPASSGVSAAMEERMQRYVARVTGTDEATARALRDGYYASYGTTLAGLMREQQIDTEDYLCDVHDLPVDALIAPDPELDRLIGLLPMRKAIFTNGTIEWARAVLGRLGIAHHFPQIYDIRFAKLAPKPEPAFYHAVLADLGAQPSDALIIEDSLRNLATARALGMATILVDELGALPTAPADLIVPNVRDAVRAILELGG